MMTRNTLQQTATVLRTGSEGRSRRGFTLVEMLVAVALVLLMMSLFASIFSIASSSVTVQRAISRTDQKARSLTTLIRTDLEHRTMRYPFPFTPDESSADSLTPFGDRSGYLYISTNDPDSGLDDLIQFTVSSEILKEDTDSTPYFGKAAFLPGGGSLSVNLNQPEADDGILIPNGTGSSTAAEVCYFVRAGNLYRRVTLLRDPLLVAGGDLDEQPKTGNGTEYFTAAANGTFTVQGAGAVDDYWTHFDYSAIREEADGTPEPSGSELLGVSALNNDLESQGAAGVALGNPRFRFGFNQLTGLSREHTSSGGFFIGRFTQAETSAVNFNWPQRPAHVDGDPSTTFGTGGSPDGNPFNIANVVNVQANGVVAEFSDTVGGTQSGRGGVRKMEDLVMTGVHEMKIEVWDQRLQKFTTPGHNESVEMVDVNGNTVRIYGDYHRDRRYTDSLSYGPEGSSLGVFDTWHPKYDRDGNGKRDYAPYVAWRYQPPAVADGSRVVAQPNEPDRVTRSYDNKGIWQAGRQYQLGDIVFGFQDRDIPPNNSFDPGVDQVDFSIAYRFVRQISGSVSGGTPPFRPPSTPGSRVREVNGTIEWEAVDNRVPLKSIRVTLRIHDVTTDALRNLTLIIPLTDKEY